MDASKLENRVEAFDGENLITVRRQPDDDSAGRFKLKDIAGVRLDAMTGGYQQGTGRDFLFGYAFCTSLVDGAIGHSCVHGPPPHNIKVCILESDNEPAVFRHLCGLAGHPNHTDADYSGGPLCAECGKEYSGYRWDFGDPAFDGIDTDVDASFSLLEEFPNLCAACFAGKLRARLAAPPVD